MSCEVALNHRLEPGQIFGMTNKRRHGQFRQCDLLTVAKPLAGNQLERIWCRTGGLRDALTGIDKRVTLNLPEDDPGARHSEQRHDLRRRCRHDARDSVRRQNLRSEPLDCCHPSTGGFANDPASGAMEIDAGVGHLTPRPERCSRPRRSLPASAATQAIGK